MRRGGGDVEENKPCREWYKKRWDAFSIIAIPTAKKLKNVYITTNVDATVPREHFKRAKYFQCYATRGFAKHPTSKN